jgi:addiction module HigA family antidote
LEVSDRVYISRSCLYRIKTFFECRKQGGNDIVNGRRGVTPSTALRLAKFFGMSADFWMNLQLRWDLYFAQKEEASALQEIHPYGSPAD